MSNKAFEKGLELRRKMLGPEGADKKLEAASDFIKPLEEWVTQQCFGEAWQRPVLDLKTRSMLTIAMLVSMGQNYHVKHHVRGAIANGVTKDEIREVLMHAVIYCGLPQTVHAMLAAEEALKEMKLL
ncbi:MAG: Gamma-carboxymuconolactone decarboxylase protein [Gammaproteobacteria bacterium]|nr:Gamma-carboxymuconolactone decarboxylase protein [Gammaproteobacteria bacterium]